MKGVGKRCNGEIIYADDSGFALDQILRSFGSHRNVIFVKGFSQPVFVRVYRLEKDALEPVSRLRLAFRMPVCIDTPS